MRNYHVSGEAIDRRIREEYRFMHRARRKARSASSHTDQRVWNEIAQDHSHWLAELLAIRREALGWRSLDYLAFRRQHPDFEPFVGGRRSSGVQR